MFGGILTMDGLGIAIGFHELGLIIGFLQKEKRRERTEPVLVSR
jgi:hypothetical protein